MDFASIRDMIAKIEGVLNVKVVNENDELVEVHILANSLRAPKQIVRDIESALLAAFDYRIDRKIISIAQIQTEDNDPIRRVRYSGIDFKTEGSALECSVRLTHDGEEYEEPVTLVKTVANAKRIVAEAAIKTIEKILGQAYLFSVEDVISSASRNITYITVIVSMVIDDREELMIGSAIVKNDINEAIAKAALDAVNRRIQRGV
ncbi:hypothetical protein JK636_15915 [Clostridium sp. YIM B02515]|uniref:Uncharacterized protein n=1 Tax=Clostridium rhizosphaerae TaxID=2803861 RepID=A0ABS1TCX9_9CLOT|nr:hypothetical protein [Clostridium rhizosphaerae]MBL4937214.1 hypothetical protein [Clostridium rhizosphaerae]